MPPTPSTPMGRRVLGSSISVFQATLFALGSCGRTVLIGQHRAEVGRNSSNFGLKSHRSAKLRPPRQIHIGPNLSKSTKLVPDQAGFLEIYRSKSVAKGFARMAQCAVDPTKD